MVRATVVALAARGPSFLPSLFSVLHNLDPPVQETLIPVLAGMGPVTLPPLLTALSREPEIAGFAEDLVAALGEPGTGTLLDILIADPPLADGSLLLLDPPGRDTATLIASRVGTVPPEARERLLALLIRAGPDALFPLIELLSSEEEDLRLSAAATIAQFGKAASGPLVKVMAREGSQGGAAQAVLVHLKEDAIPALVSCLYQEDEATRKTAVSCLAEIGETAAPALVVLLSSPEPAAAVAATEALVRIGEPALPWCVDSLESQTDEGRDRALKVLVRGGPAGIPLLTEAMRNPREPVRNTAVFTLALIGEPAVLALTGLLHDPAPIVRSGAAVALSRMGAPAIGPLVKELGSGNTDSRNAALVTLVRLGPLASPALVEAFFSHQDLIREYAKRALVMIGAPALPALIDRIGAVDETTSTEFSHIMTRMGRKGRDALYEALPGSPRPLRRIIAGQIRHFPDVPTDLTVRTALFFAMEDWERLVLEGEPALPVLFEGFSDEDPEIREACAQAAAAIGECALPGLVRCLSSSGPRVRDTARMALVRSGEPGISVLVPLLSGSDPALADQAAETLLLIGGPALPFLNKAALTGDTATLAPTTTLLGRMGEPGFSILVSLLGDPERGPYAIRALARTGSPAVPALLRVIRSGTRAASRQGAVALSLLEEPRAGLILDALSVSSGDETQNLCAALETGGKPWVPCIIGWFREHPGERPADQAVTEIVSALVQDDREALLGLLASKVPIFMTEASRLLSAIGPDIVPDLIRLAGETDPGLRPVILSTIQSVGPEAAPVLTETAMNEDAPLPSRTCCITALGNLDKKESDPVLIALTRDRDPSVRAVAMQTVRLTAAGKEACKAGLYDPEPDVAGISARRIGLMGREGIGPLMEAVSHPSGHVRRSAVIGLAVLGEPAVYLLSRTLWDPDPLVRTAAARAFEDLGIVPEYALDALRLESIRSGSGGGVRG